MLTPAPAATASLIRFCFRDRRASRLRRLIGLLAVAAVWSICLLDLACATETLGTAASPTTPITTSVIQKNDTVDTLVIHAAGLANAIGPWVDYRQRQGHRLAVVPSQGSARKNRYLVKIAAANFDHLKQVVLIGDAGDWRLPPTSLLPADHVSATVNVHFGSEFDIATDNTFADVNGDQVPDLAIGRIIASTPQQFADYFAHIVRYEADTDATWRRRINLVAGVGGFGGLIDALIENTAKQIITDKIPADYNATVTYGNWRSPFCPDPRKFSATAIDRFNEGCLFWIYVGHGQRRRLDQVRVPKHRFEILDSDSVKKLDCRSGSPIALFLACYTGAIDSSRDCLAEQMIKRPRGPIAVISGSRVTMPYAMGLLSLELADEYFAGDAETLGELLRRGKVRLMSKPRKPLDPYRTMIQAMGESLSPLPDRLHQEKIEHLNMVNLLGDPLLRIKRPQSVSIECPMEAVSDSALKITGTAPHAGTMLVDLAYPRNRFKKRPKRRRKFSPADDVLAAYQTQYRQVHDLVFTQKQVAVTKGKFDLTIDVPAAAKGKCQIRAMISDPHQGRFALGSSDVLIKKRNLQADHRENQTARLQPTVLTEQESTEYKQ